jgi:hypothetical protein
MKQNFDELAQFNNRILDALKDPVGNPALTNAIRQHIANQVEKDASCLVDLGTILARKLVPLLSPYQVSELLVTIGNTEVTVSMTTHRLPREIADAIFRFLQDNAQAEHLPFAISIPKQK